MVWKVGAARARRVGASVCRSPSAGGLAGPSRAPEPLGWRPARRRRRSWARAAAGARRGLRCVRPRKHPPAEAPQRAQASA
eukprot:475589-Lingulodinium_polyedra.AAC.1